MHSLCVVTNDKLWNQQCAAWSGSHHIEASTLHCQWEGQKMIHNYAARSNSIFIANRYIHSQWIYFQLKPTSEWYSGAVQKLRAELFALLLYYSTEPLVCGFGKQNFGKAQLHVWTYQNYNHTLNLLVAYKDHQVRKSCVGSTKFVPLLACCMLCNQAWELELTVTLTSGLWKTPCCHSQQQPALWPSTRRPSRATVEPNDPRLCKSLGETALYIVAYTSSWTVKQHIRI